MADLLGLIAGGIGSAAGVIALVYAHIANNNAKRSTRIAEDSRDLAVEANDLARESNTIALGASKAARKANDISARAEARETERHDVHWEGDWQRPGIYVLTKLGADEACYIKATVTYDDERVTKTVETIVKDGHRLDFRFHTATADFDAEVIERQQQLRSSDPHGIGVASMWGRHPHRVTERVEWTTAQGTPKLHQQDSLLTVFDGFYPE